MTAAARREGPGFFLDQRLDIRHHPVDVMFPDVVGGRAQLFGRSVRQLGDLFAAGRLSAFS